MKAAEINKIWGKQFLDTFTGMDASIVFAVAVTKEGKVRVCQTTDVTPKEMIAIVEKLLKGMKGE